MIPAAVQGASSAAAVNSSSSSSSTSTPYPSSPLIAYALRLEPGADVYAHLMQFLSDTQTEAASILSAVGSLTHAHIRFANVPDSLTQPLPQAHYEVVSLSGVMSRSGGSHIHMSISDNTGRTIGGHLMPTGNLVYTTLELVLGVMPDYVFKRETDTTFGYQELVVYNKEGVAAPAAAAAIAGYKRKELPESEETNSSNSPCCGSEAKDASTGSNKKVKESEQK